MVGAGYIAVELAGMMQILGSDVSLLIRYDKVIIEFRFVYLICAWFSEMSGISSWYLSSARDFTEVVHVRQFINAYSMW